MRDYMMGFGFGVNNNKNLFQARLNFDFRPYFKNVTFKENDTLNYQYKEKDYFINISIEKQFNITKSFPSVRPYLQMNAGLLWGNFKGWDKSPEQKFIVSGGAGAFLALNNIFGFKVGYQYFKPLVLLTTPHRLFLQIQINFYE